MYSIDLMVSLELVDVLKTHPTSRKEDSVTGTLDMLRRTSYAMLCSLLEEVEMCVLSKE